MDGVEKYLLPIRCLFIEGEVAWENILCIEKYRPKLLFYNGIISRVRVMA